MEDARNTTDPRADSTTNEAALFSRAQNALGDQFDLEQIVAASPTRALFLVRNTVLKRREALRIHLEPHGRSRRWFERETELLAALDHRAIRAVYHAGYCGDWAYRVSKWIDGESLLDAVHRSPRPIPAVLQMARDLINALEYASGEQIVLRRIVPTSVMLDRSGRAVITDLRFANRCLTYASLDSEPEADAFLAPETWHGNAGDAASDIYAVGALLYFATTGTPPASNPTEIVPPRVLRAACPAALERIILRAMQQDPRNRYLNAGDMAADLLSELGDFEAGTTALRIVNPSESPAAWEKGLRRALGDEYELLDELGQGGFGFVYRVRDLRLEREVALKVLHPFLTTEPADVERFRKEAQLAAQLHHPNIVSIYDIDSRNGLLFYTMAHVAGQHLGKMVQTHGTLPLVRFLVLMHEALEALGHAHSHGVVHRDIKPENMLIESSDGSLRITDFGLAMALQGERYGGASSHSGTPEFASPEQMLGEPVDLRSDLYSLSAVAFFVLTGRPPFGEGTAESVLARQTTRELPNIRECRQDVPESVINVLTRGAAQLPEDRFSSAGEYAEALRDSARIAALTPVAWVRRFVRSVMPRRPRHSPPR